MFPIDGIKPVTFKENYSQFFGPTELVLNYVLKYTVVVNFTVTCIARLCYNSAILSGRKWAVCFKFCSSKTEPIDIITNELPCHNETV